MKKLLLLLVRAYQVALSPFIGRSCRFHPSCSHYAAEAIREHGAAKGTVLTAKRICKCNPWHPGGYDPVPPHGDASGAKAETKPCGTSGTKPDSGLGNEPDTRPDGGNRSPRFSDFS